MINSYSYMYKGTEGYNEHAKFAMETITDVIQWGRAKELNDPKAQLNKTLEELGEIAHEISRNRYESDELSDAIGDTLVTLLILSDIVDMDPIACLAGAYEVINQRTGKTEDGTFIKDNQ